MKVIFRYLIQIIICIVFFNLALFAEEGEKKPFIKTPSMELVEQREGAVGGVRLNAATDRDIERIGGFIYMQELDQYIHKKFRLHEKKIVGRY